MTVDLAVISSGCAYVFMGSVYLKCYDYVEPGHCIHVHDVV